MKNKTNPTQVEKGQQPKFEFMSLQFQAIPVSPSVAETPLQIVCFFDQSKNQTYAGGTELVDGKFDGAIKQLRAEDHFHGDFLETLLITPSNSQIPAERLLLVGLGDPEKFDVAAMRAVGRVAMNEAIKLGVRSFSFAPSIKDAGVSTIPAGDVSTVLAEGMMRAYQSAVALSERGLVPTLQLEEVVFLAGAAHIGDSQKGLQKAIEIERSRK